MRCDIYNSQSKYAVRLYIKEGGIPQELVPPQELQELLPLESKDDFKSVAFTSDEPVMGIDVSELIENITKKGYYIHKFEVKIETKISEAGAAFGGGLLLASLGGGPVGAIIGAAVGYLLASSNKETNKDES